MKKVAIVYYSMTGNTEAMAEAVLAGLEEGGTEATLFPSSAFTADMVDSFDGIAFGCPAMGDEELEEEEFEPLFTACEDKLGQKPIVLFGSYSWADGEWMILWKERCANANLHVVDTTIAYDHPDEEAEKACQGLGKALAEALGA